MERDGGGLWLCIEHDRMFAARVGVGMGKAELAPAAYSMILDSFPPERRAPAIAVFSVGTILGIGTVLIAGGGVTQWATDVPSIKLPLVRELHGWQLAFIIVALPGALLTPVVLALREPARQGAGRALDGAAIYAVTFLRRHGGSFLLLILVT
ncbi:MFS transporter [Sphingobium xenophagum]|uniref:MFS transporter n=1 Tax=Sphingobium xenophagum TaxID=121428 RepID=UPI0003A822F9|nr:MFS transporter [Sphingobium xenophagum]